MSYDLNNIVKLAKVTEPTIFNDSQIEVINSLIKFQDYYDNKAFDYICIDYPEFRHGRVDGKDYKPAHIPLNFAKLIINKLAAWQFEEGIDFECKSESTDSDDPNTVNRSDEIEKDLYDIHKKNLMDIKLLQSAVESNIAGGVVFKLKYDEAKSYPRILIRNRIECFPVYEFDDYENIYKVHFIAFQDEKTIWKQTYELIKGKDKDVCFISEALFDTKNIETPSKEIIKYQPLKINGKTIDFLPVYIVPNMAQLGEIWGLSELSDLIPIIDEINKKYSDLSDSLKFDMFAVTVFLNAKVPTGKDGAVELKNKAGAAWQLMGMSPTDNVRPEVFKLQGTFNYAETLKYHIDSLISCLFEFAECVNISSETVQGLPAISGIALKLLFASIVSKTNRKNLTWKAKLRDIYFGALKLKQLYEGGYEIPDDLDIEIIIHDTLPQNELEELNVITQKLADGLISVESAMNELGVEDPALEIAKILAEKQQYDKALNVDTRNQANQSTNQPTDNTNNQGNLNGNQ